MNWSSQQWMLVIPAVLGCLAVYLLLPKSESPRFKKNWGGWALGIAALVAAGLLWVRPSGLPVQDVLFDLFAAFAIIAGVCMIANTNPVYAALWFALATLSTCGLFLLQSAPFLAAATTIVYAGAIVVTFLFVIMLARQSGAADYDRHAREPLVATLTAFVLLGGMLYTQKDWRKTELAGEPGAADAAADSAAATGSADAVSSGSRFLIGPGKSPNTLSHSPQGEIGTMRGLGRSLFGDYLVAVEIAGTLLLVASIGAILIAPRRSPEKP